MLPVNGARLHVSGDLRIDAVDEAGVPPRSTSAAVPALTGRLTREGTGVPQPDLRVVALNATNGAPAREVAFATSNGDGRFRIVFDELPAHLRVRVDGSDGHALLTSDEIALVGGSADVTLAIPAPPRAVAPESWTSLGDYLVSARIGHLDDVVKVLRANGTSSIAGSAPPDISPETRVAMLEQLERAFLDPTGILARANVAVPTLQELHDPDQASAYVKALREHPAGAGANAALADLQGKAASFASLGEVDWEIDPQALRDGKLGEAVAKFGDRYKFDDLFQVLPSTDLTLYRDYLLAIWTTYAPKIVYVAPNVLTSAQALEQLTTRFHQPFTTLDDAPRVANEVLVPILTSILTAPTGKGFGFGVAPASIPARGTTAARAYLDTLIALSGVSATELGLRYRLDFSRSDAALSSPVQENIATLQGFFRDSFQWELDPVHVNPDVHDQPIIPDVWIGNAPFFLYYDEWLRQRQPFYPENHLDIRAVLPVAIDDEYRGILANLAAGKISGQSANIPLWKFYQEVVAIWDTLQKGHAHYYAGEYALAMATYQKAGNAAAAAMQDNILQTRAMAPLYNQRKKLPLETMKDVKAFMNPPVFYAGGIDYTPDVPTYGIDRMAMRLAYYTLFTIPVCLGDTALALGDYERAIFLYGQATRFEVGIARESDSAGYRPWYLDAFEMYWRGDKPYTVKLSGSDAPDQAAYPLDESDDAYDEYFDTTLSGPQDTYARTWARRIPHLAEIRYCRLRQAAAMLEWADQLYRLNDKTPAARARELYKGVLWLHGKIPPIAPTWPLAFSFVPPLFKHQAENPALVSQTARAQRGIFQIDRGLNYYGESDEIVPILRYRPLKDTADRMAAMARGAQDDFIAYTGHVEEAITARMQLTNFLQKAKLQASIATEQQAIAAHDVVVAQDQVAAVQAAIKAKQDEIAKADSLFGQIGDAISGMKSVFTSLPDDTKSAVGAGATSEATGNELVGEGMLGLGAGASITAGIGIFFVAGYITLSGMSDAANKRSADLATLAQKALPAAQAAVVARQHAVTIATLQQQIAQADVDLAQSLLAFEQDRTLNLNFWLQLSQVARRLLRRYLELGARTSWLAERALAYEQDRTLSIVRMDYFPAALQGVTGADLMRADLAELDATRIEGMKRTVPVTRTFSLARDFPLQYGQLKKLGRCRFRTEEAAMRQAYPGTSGYRIRAVSTTVQQLDFSTPLRGSLINQGVSISKPGQAGEHVLVRPSESLPISEFRLQNDMALYGLPGETLLTFEGSNIETFWELSFPTAANGNGLDGLLDVLVSFDAFCEFAPERYELDLAALAKTDRKWLLVSGAQFQPAALAALAGAAPKASFVYDISALRLIPRQATDPKIKNVALLLATPDDLSVKATFSSSTPATSAGVTLAHGFATSSLQPAAGLPALPPAPLDVFADASARQTFTVEIDKVANPGVAFNRVTDVVLALEYESTLM